jgi:hypothetical protein
MSIDELIERFRKLAVTRDAVLQQEYEALQFIVKMAVLNEREECAKLCERIANMHYEDGSWEQGCYYCATRIRTRRKK